MVIDLLLAVYNGEKVLPALLESLDKQTLPLNILWQDDGEDNSRALLKGTEVCLPHEKGAKGNFMSLLTASQGDYLMFCDQDDRWDPDKVEKTFRKMQEGEALYGKETPLLVHTDLRVTDPQGKVIKPSLFKHQGWDPKANTLNRLLVQNNVTGCTVMMNRALREKLLKADSKAMFMHDWWAALTCAAFGHILFVDEPLMDYCQHGSNQVGASTKSLIKRAAGALGAWKKGRERIRLTYRQARAFYETYGEELPEKARLCVENYLAVEKKIKPARVLALHRGDYRMQSFVTRLGHCLFG